MRVPAWLIVDGADASAEAVLGLAARVQAAPADTTSRDAMRSSPRGSPRCPRDRSRLGPTARSSRGRSPSQHVARVGLADARSARPGVRRPRRPRARGAGPHGCRRLHPDPLTAGGPDNGWFPSPADRVQIAYGAGRAGAVAARRRRRHRFRRLRSAGRHAAAAWFFGANRAGEPMYDPATGVTYDGLQPRHDQPQQRRRVHDPRPVVHDRARLPTGTPARSATPSGLNGVEQRDGLRVLEAEKGRLTGSAAVVRPESPWTGESQYSGDAYVALHDGDGINWTLPDGNSPLLVSPVVDLVAERGAGSTVWRHGSQRVGRVDHGTGGEQGISEAPGALTPVALPAVVKPGERLSARAEGVGGSALRVDSLLVRPVVSKLVLSGPARSLALMSNGDSRTRRAKVVLPGEGPVTVDLYDDRARPSAAVPAAARRPKWPSPPTGSRSSAVTGTAADGRRACAHAQPAVPEPVLHQTRHIRAQAAAPPTRLISRGRTRCPRGRPSRCGRRRAAGAGSWRCSRVAPRATSRSASASRAAIRSSPCEPGRGPHVEVHAVLGRLALRHPLEEQPRPGAVGVDAAPRRRCGSSGGTPIASSASSQESKPAGGSCSGSRAPRPRTRPARPGRRSRR